MGPGQTSVIVARPSLMDKNEEDSSLPDSFNIGDNEFLYTESKRSRIDRDRDEKCFSAMNEKNKRPRFEEDLELDSSDIALATVPGQSFDPKERCFNIEELRPQPIIRKRKKTHVPEHEKDDKYWEKRTKNTQATKRAREAKRLKENQIILRAAFLEPENKRLTEELEKVAMERDSLMQKLATYEKQKLATLEKSQLSVKFNYMPSDTSNILTYVDPKADNISTYVDSLVESHFNEVSSFCPIATAAAMYSSSTDLTSTTGVGGVPVTHHSPRGMVSPFPDLMYSSSTDLIPIQPSIYSTATSSFQTNSTDQVHCPVSTM